MTRPAGLSFVCYAMLWNSIGLMLGGVIISFGAISGIPFWVGPLLLLSGFALGRAVGDFLRMDVKGTTMYRIAAIIFSAFISAGLAPAPSRVNFGSVAMTILIFAFALLFWFLIEVYIREKIGEAN